MPRLATCHRCRVLQKFPDVPQGTPMVPARMVWTDGADFTFKDDKGYPVMVPAFDPVLEDFVERHEHGQDDQTFVNGKAIEVWEVDKKTWDSVDVVQKIKAELHEMTAQWYEDRDTYREGAIECYNQHGNPDLSDGCPDFLSDSKMIGRARYRDDDGKPHEIPAKFRQYLCHQCPYFQTYVVGEMRQRKGLYK